MLIFSQLMTSEVVKYESLDPMSWFEEAGSRELLAKNRRNLIEVFPAIFGGEQQNSLAEMLKRSSRILIAPKQILEKSGNLMEVEVDGFEHLGFKRMSLRLYKRSYDAEDGGVSLQATLHGTSLLEEAEKGIAREENYLFVDWRVRIEGLSNFVYLKFQGDLEKPHRDEEYEDPSGRIKIYIEDSGVSIENAEYSEQNNRAIINYINFPSQRAMGQLVLPVAIQAVGFK